MGTGGCSEPTNADHLWRDRCVVGFDPDLAALGWREVERVVGVAGGGAGTATRVRIVYDLGAAVRLTVSRVAVSSR